MHRRDRQKAGEKTARLPEGTVCQCADCVSQRKVIPKAKAAGKPRRLWQVKLQMNKHTLIETGTELALKASDNTASSEALGFFQVSF